MSMPSASILHLGLDVHKESVVSAVHADDAPQPRQVDTLPYDLGRLKRYLDRLARDGAQLRCVYEASGAGYVLQRAIQSWGYHCDICAPSLTPQRPGHQLLHRARPVRGSPRPDLLPDAGNNGHGPVRHVEHLGQHQQRSVRLGLLCEHRQRRLRGLALRLTSRREGPS